MWQKSDGDAPHDTGWYFFHIIDYETNLSHFSANETVCSARIQQK